MKRNRFAAITFAMLCCAWILSSCDEDEVKAEQYIIGMNV